MRRSRLKQRLLVGGQRLFIVMSALVWLTAVFHPSSALAAWFKNSEQRGAEAFEQGEYESAAKTFRDKYRKGVALYRASRFGEAAEVFSRVTRSEVYLDAQYNLGNARFMQGKYEMAVEAYEKVISERPDDDDARHNLALARALLARMPEEAEEQEQEQQEEKERQEKERQRREQQEQERSRGPHDTNPSTGGKINRLRAARRGPGGDSRPRG